MGLPEAKRPCGDSGFPLQMGDSRLVNMVVGSVNCVLRPRFLWFQRLVSAWQPHHLLSAARWGGGQDHLTLGSLCSLKEGQREAFRFCLQLSGAGHSTVFSGTATSNGVHAVLSGMISTPGRAHQMGQQRRGRKDSTVEPGTVLGTFTYAILCIFANKGFS